MEFVVVGLLLLRPATLYGLYHSFDQGISLFYAASYGSLNNALKRLLANGLVEVRQSIVNGRNNKLYSVTAQGQQAFFNWMLEQPTPKNLETAALSRVYFLGLLPTPALRAQVVRQILAAIDASAQALQQVDEAVGAIQVPPAYQPILTYQLATLRYGLASHHFSRRWFADLLAGLEAEKT